jgi:cytochrome c oxidase subunit 2
MRRPGTRRFVRRALTVGSIPFLALLSISTAFAQQPTAVTEEAEKMHDLYIFVTVLAFAVFVIVAGVLVVALVRFRKSGDELPKQVHGSTVLEMLWVAIPVLLVVIMFSYSIVILVDVNDEAEPEDLTIGVQGFQFGWTFTYTLNDLGTNSDPSAEGSFPITGSAGNEPELVIPVGEPVEFELVSNDVIHSFYVRNFLYKLDVIPGRSNAFKVTATKTGTYHGQCAELCGIDHALMRFTIRIVERDEFDAWVAEQMGDAAVRQPQ